MSDKAQKDRNKPWKTDQSTFGSGVVVISVLELLVNDKICSLLLCVYISVTGFVKASPN